MSRQAERRERVEVDLDVLIPVRRRICELEWLVLGYEELIREFDSPNLSAQAAALYPDEEEDEEDE